MNGKVCNQAGCDAPAIALGLCRKHYSRRRRGTLDVPAQPPAGSPSGHGQWGVLERTWESVMCHECGRWFGQLGAHLHHAHGMTAADYRALHGLPRTLGLVSLGESQMRSEKGRANVGSPAWQRLVAKRDPRAASSSRTVESFRSPAAIRTAAVHGEVVSRRNRGSGKVKTCPVCGAQFQGRTKACGRRECVSVVRSLARVGTRKPRMDAAMVEWLKQDPRGRGAQAVRDGWSKAAVCEALGVSASWGSVHLPSPPRTAS